MHLQLKELFTEEEMNAAVHLFCTVPPHTFAKRCEAEIVAPAIHRINKVTGQENSTLYIAYAIQSVLSLTR